MSTASTRKLFDIAPEDLERHDDVRRLSDIAVEEVSLVDRGANKRRFIVVKAEGPAGAAPGATWPRDINDLPEPAAAPRTAAKARPRGADASWPVDLNAPVDRASVQAQKRVSFHEA